MTQRYRLAPSARVSRDLSNLLYRAAEALEPNNNNMTPQVRAEIRESLIGASAGALVNKPPAAVLATLVWVVEMAQNRASENEFNSAQEELDEHGALAFAADWLEAEGLDVAEIRAAQPAAGYLAELRAKVADAQAELDALERAKPPEPVDIIADILDDRDAPALAADVLSALSRAGYAVVPELWSVTVSWPPEDDVTPYRRICASEAVAREKAAGLAREELENAFPDDYTEEALAALSDADAITLAEERCGVRVEIDSVEIEKEA
jgi:hypothetical protein